MAFEVARRHRFVTDLANVPEGVQVHVLPSGDEGTPLANLRYRDSRSVRTRIERAHDATARHLAALGARRRDRADGVKALPVPPWIVRRAAHRPADAGADAGVPCVAAARDRRARRSARSWSSRCDAAGCGGGFPGSGRSPSSTSSARPPAWWRVWCCGSARGSEPGCTPNGSCAGISALLRAFLSALVAVAGFVFRFRLEVEEPLTHPDDTSRMAAPRPLLVLARHAGPGASFVLVHLLLTRYHRRPRIVLKEQLRLDPSFDVLISRIGGRFIAPGKGRPGVAAEAIAEVAADLTERDALLLYPEGGDWTPTRHRLAVAGLRRRGRRAQAARAARMPHVLPPKPAGTLAALRAAPHADVVVFTHTGHDELLDIVSIWDALPLRCAPTPGLVARSRGRRFPTTTAPARTG